MIHKSEVTFRAAVEVLWETTLAKLKAATWLLSEQAASPGGVKQGLSLTPVCTCLAQVLHSSKFQYTTDNKYRRLYHKYTWQNSRDVKENLPPPRLKFHQSNVDMSSYNRFEVVCSPMLVERKQCVSPHLETGLNAALEIVASAKSTKRASGRFLWKSGIWKLFIPSQLQLFLAELFVPFLARPISLD